LPGGTAEGKLRPGDIILKVGSQDATDTGALARLLVSWAPGTTYPVTFLRDEALHTATITIGREEIDPLKALSQQAVASSDAAWFMKPSDPGFQLAAIGPTERKRFLLDAGYQRRCRDAR
jgi:serine protease Do